MKIIIATGNAGKIKEFKKILEGEEIVSMKEAGLFAEPEENGKTYMDNALIKARALSVRIRESGLEAIAIADDSGLSVDALGGMPGVYSSRYMGEKTSYDIKNQAIIDQLASVPEEARTARFVCAIAAVLPDGRELGSEGVIEGVIGHEIRGEGGFGYDPIFYVPAYGKTTAELSETEKNEISHRGKALRLMKDALAKALADSAVNN